MKIKGKKKAMHYSNWVESMIVTEGNDRLIENTLGLVGEAGEVAEKIKKWLRDDNYNDIDNQAIVAELGDVLFYVVAMGNYLQYSLDEIIQLNVDKLESRKKRGCISGSGDNR